VALACVDCDIKHGMIVAFDDYFCWSSTQISGERRAFVEFVAAG
jgi:hypothetical protein